MTNVYSAVPHALKNSDRPKARDRRTVHIVMGNASQCTPVIDFLKKKFRCDVMHQPPALQENIVMDASVLKKEDIQNQINALAKKDYTIELHWADLGVRSSRSERITYQTLATKNYGKIETHRWSKQNNRLQQNDQQLISACFKQLIENRQHQRRDALKAMDCRDSNQKEMNQHNQRIQALLNLHPNTRSSHEMLLAIVSDISNYPELYLDDPHKLDDFYTLVDRSECRVYYTSIQRKLPVKSHGCVAIGSPQLTEGIIFSAAGDIRRGKLKLPNGFQLRLIEALEKKEPLPNHVIRQFGSKKAIIKDLKSGENVDSQAIRELLTHCNFQPLTDEYIKEIQFNSKYKRGFELWHKPRSGQQAIDRERFNKHFPVFLADGMQSNIAWTFGQLHHWITRQTEIREQQISCSQLIKRWLTLSAYQKQVDAHRNLLYKDKSAFWQFEDLALFPQQGNCNTISTHLLGKEPITASMTNIGTSKGLLIDKTVYATEPHLNRINKIIQQFFTYLERVHASFAYDENLDLFIEEIEMLNEALSKGIINISSYIKITRETLLDYKPQLNHVAAGQRRTIFEYISDMFQSFFTLLYFIFNKNQKQSLFRPNQNLTSAMAAFESELENLALNIEHPVKTSNTFR